MLSYTYALCQENYLPMTPRSSDIDSHEELYSALTFLILLLVCKCESYWYAYMPSLLFQYFDREKENFLLRPTCPHIPGHSSLYVINRLQSTTCSIKTYINTISHYLAA